MIPDNVADPRAARARRDLIGAPLYKDELTGADVRRDTYEYARWRGDASFAEAQITEWYQEDKATYEKLTGTPYIPEGATAMRVAFEGAGMGDRAAFAEAVSKAGLSSTINTDYAARLAERRGDVAASIRERSKRYPRTIGQEFAGNTLAFMHDPVQQAATLAAVFTGGSTFLARAGAEFVTNAAGEALTTPTKLEAAPAMGEEGYGYKQAVFEALMAGAMGAVGGAGLEAAAKGISLGATAARRWRDPAGFHLESWAAHIESLPVDTVDTYRTLRYLDHTNDVAYALAKGGELPDPPAGLYDHDIAVGTASRWLRDNPSMYTQAEVARIMEDLTPDNSAAKTTMEKLSREGLTEANYAEWRAYAPPRLRERLDQMLARPVQSLQDVMRQLDPTTIRVMEVAQMRKVAAAQVLRKEVAAADVFDIPAGGLDARIAQLRSKGKLTKAEQRELQDYLDMQDMQRGTGAAPTETQKETARRIYESADIAQRDLAEKLSALRTKAEALQGSMGSFASAMDEYGRPDKILSKARRALLEERTTPPLETKVTTTGANPKGAIEELRSKLSDSYSMRDLYMEQRPYKVSEAPDIAEAELQQAMAAKPADPLGVDGDEFTARVEQDILTAGKDAAMLREALDEMNSYRNNLRAFKECMNG